MRASGAILLLYLSLSLVCPLAAVPIQDYDGALADLSLASDLEIYEDAAGDAALANVLQDSGGWRPNRQAIPAFGYTESAYWLRFSVKNNGNAEQSALVFIDNEYLDRIDLYELIEGRLIGRRSSGRSFPFSSREFAHTRYAFRVDFPEGRNKTIILRVQSRNTLSVPLALVHEQRYQESMLFQQTRIGFYAGLVGLWFVLNMIFYFAFRDANFLYYCFYLVCTTTFQFSLQGCAFQYLWPEWPVWNALFNGIASTFGLISVVMFGRSFLRTRLHLPAIDRLMKFGMIVIAFGLALLPISIRVAEAYIGGVSLLTTVVLCELAGWSLFLKGYRPARFYLIAWTLFFTAGVIYMLQVFVILPPRIFGLYMIDFVFLGQLGEILFFPLAIGDRIRTKLNENRAAGIEEPRTRMSRLLRVDLNVVREKLREAMDEKRVYRTALTLRELAAHVGISEKDLSEYLNRVLHQSFYEYLNEYRIREAAELLLKYPERKVIEIAYEVGFNNLSTFNRSFLLQVGRSPREHRRIHGGSSKLAPPQTNSRAGEA